MQHISFGIVGTGSMAATMITALRSVPAVSIGAVHSNSSERAQSFALAYDIPKAISRLDDLLNDDTLTAIYIANATEFHATTAIKALTAGKAVLCEKPAALSAQDFKAIADAAKKHNVLFMEGLWTLCLPAYQNLLRSNECAKLGRVKHLSASFGYPATPLSYPQLYSAKGGGVLLDRAVYLLGLACALMGEVERVVAVLDKTPEGIDTHASILLEHKSGQSAQLTASFDALLSNDITLGCENGSIHIPAPALGAENSKTQFFYSHHTPRQDVLATHSKQKWLHKLKHHSQIRRAKHLLTRLSGQHHSFGVNPYTPQIQHFCDLLRSDRKESDIVTHTLSLQIMNVIDMINRGARN